VAKLGRLVDIRISRRNDYGRPMAFELTDASGAVFELSAERFRGACNVDIEGLPPLGRSARLPSSFVQPIVESEAVWFTNGRGFGHGVGLDQWGAQELAESGASLKQVLGRYYPGAGLRRLY
jgi:stage II sporulation protein D